MEVCTFVGVVTRAFAVPGEPLSKSALRQGPGGAADVAPFSPDPSGRSEVFNADAWARFTSSKGWVRRRTGLGGRQATLGFRRLMRGRSRVAASTVGRLRSDARGAVALLFALLAPVLVLIAFGIIDISSVFEAKTHLQDSTDAAALAVSAADSANPNTTEAALKIIATNLIAANFTTGGAAISSFSVCSPTQTTDCATTPSGTPIITDTVSIATQVRASCWAPVILPGVCTNGTQSMLITVKNTTNIGFPANIQINLVLDTSGSMIVGATANDVQDVVNWNNVTDKNGNLVNWNTVKDTGDKYQNLPLRLRLPRPSLQQLNHLRFSELGHAGRPY